MVRQFFIYLFIFPFLFIYYYFVYEDILKEQCDEFERREDVDMLEPHLHFVKSNRQIANPMIKVENHDACIEAEVVLHWKPSKFSTKIIGNKVCVW